MLSEFVAPALCLPCRAIDAIDAICLAAPVVDHAGDCLFTISIVMPESKAIQVSEQFGKALQIVAARIEARLGWQQRDPA